MFRLLFRIAKTGVLYSGFIRDYVRFRRALIATGPRFTCSWSDRYPCLHDKTSATSFDRHYVYHPAWAARVLSSTRPRYHVDISSSLHFSTLVSAFIPTIFLDYRPANLAISGLTEGAADLCGLSLPDDSVPSLSCMHVIEHIGLGRYGDKLDPEGDLKAIAELKRVLAPGGNLLIVVPVGRPRIMFNAHRVYAYEQVVERFSEMELKEFALVPDSAQDGGLIRDASESLSDRQSYGCGCFWFQKRT